MRNEVPNHEPSLFMINCGAIQPGRPSMGSWLMYGLGTENRNLPGFVVLCPGTPVVGPPLPGAAVGGRASAAGGKTLGRPDVSADSRAGADEVAAQNVRSRIDHHVVFHDRMARVALDEGACGVGREAFNPGDGKGLDFIRRYRWGQAHRVGGGDSTGAVQIQVSGRAGDGARTVEPD